VLPVPWLVLLLRIQIFATLFSDFAHLISLDVSRILIVVRKLRESKMEEGDMNGYVTHVGEKTNACRFILEFWKT
jgi:hypothetical protein